MNGPVQFAYKHMWGETLKDVVERNPGGGRHNSFRNMVVLQTAGFAALSGVILSPVIKEQIQEGNISPIDHVASVTDDLPEIAIGGVTGWMSVECAGLALAIRRRQQEV